MNSLVYGHNWAGIKKTREYKQKIFTMQINVFHNPVSNHHGDLAPRIYTALV
jgi:hypothetical protein